MSTYWDVVCLDCDKDSGLHLNWGQHTCRDLIRGRDALAALANFDVCDLQLSVPGETGHVDAAFYKEHAGHVLAPVSEYGDIDGDCNELRLTGPSTTDGARCRLAPKHKGDHAYVRASRWAPEWAEVRKAAAERRRAV